MEIRLSKKPGMGIMRIRAAGSLLSALSAPSLTVLILTPGQNASPGLEARREGSERGVPMTKEEAEEVLGIMLTADGGCSHCASALFRQFLGEWPSFIEEAKRLWLERFEEEYRYHYVL